MITFRILADVSENRQVTLKVPPEVPVPQRRLEYPRGLDLGSRATAEELGERLPEGLGGGVSEEVLGTRVPESDATVRIERQDGVGGRHDHLGEASLRDLGLDPGMIERLDPAADQREHPKREHRSHDADEHELDGRREGGAEPIARPRRHRQPEDKRERGHRTRHGPAEDGDALPRCYGFRVHDDRSLGLLRRELTDVHRAARGGSESDPNECQSATAEYARGCDGRQGVFRPSA